MNPIAYIALLCTAALLAAKYISGDDLALWQCFIPIYLLIFVYLVRLIAWAVIAWLMLR